MNPALVVTLAAAVVVVASVVAVAVSLSGRRRLQAQLDAARADVDALRSTVADLAAAPPPAAPPVAPPVPDDEPEFVITSLPAGSPPRPDRAGTDLAVPAGQFASVALGESLVRVVSLGHGVRRALSAENRNRIRFEIRREVKRSRRQRRREVKEARRHLRTDLAPGRDEDAA
ncbi:hypothetical protein KRR39_06350 [Nocardioides panacis]|uniref:Uncharacterized protein n=1 Tax=Nocardioides panacis TaxID=2849501 RepID=A0A975T0L3_9ACTN|nr:hypothetical protein [Nocardioides panacis]QWZ09389.1 hypothetical protein KRR39_06350 [Nocardioides panacis]